MNGLLGALALALCVGVVVLVPELGAPAVVLLTVLTAGALLTIYYADVDRRFLLQLFAAALLLRVLLGTITYCLNLQEFFGGDAATYDGLGISLLQVWRGELRYGVIAHTMAVRNFSGMPYLVAVIYAVVGRNMLAVQFFNAVIGALTILPIYLSA